LFPLSWSLDHVGPLCRTVEDAALTLQPIAGHDPLDTNSLPVTPPDYRAVLRGKVSTLRLGVPRAVFYETLDADIARAVDAALEVLRRLTSGARDVTLPSYQILPVAGAEAYAFTPRTSPKPQSSTNR
jgi:aspartyl-tRNA(Asn)/glutamyl-tRNA(Gln) amidotransferase subunit A